VCATRQIKRTHDEELRRSVTAPHEFGGLSCSASIRQEIDKKKGNETGICIQKSEKKGTEAARRVPKEAIWEGQRVRQESTTTHKTQRREFTTENTQDKGLQRPYCYKISERELPELHDEDVGIETQQVGKSSPIGYIGEQRAAGPQDTGQR